MYDEMNGFDGNGENNTQPLEPQPQKEDSFSESDVTPSYQYEQQSAYVQQDTYQQSNYAQQNTYSYTPGYEKKPEGGIGFGIAALILGILSLLTFCTMCINIPLAVLAIIFAIVQLVKGSGKGLAIGGLITAIFSILACIVFYIVIGVNAARLETSDRYNDLYNSIYDDYYDYYYDDDTF